MSLDSTLYDTYNSSDEPDNDSVLDLGERKPLVAGSDVATASPPGDKYFSLVRCNYFVLSHH